MDNGPANWLTVEEAAAAYRLSVRTVRRRLATGELTAVKVATPNGQSWRVKPPSAPIDAGQPASGQTGLSIPLDQLEKLFAPLAQERDRLQVERDELRAQVEGLHAARLEDARQAAEEIGRLRGLLEAAQPPQPATATDPPPARRRWFWQRSG